MKVKQFWKRLIFSFVNVTLDSGINIGVRLSIFGLFPWATLLIREGNAYLCSKYPLFYDIGVAYFKGYS